MFSANLLKFVCNKLTWCRKGFSFLEMSVQALDFSPILSNFVQYCKLPIQKPNWGKNEVTRKQSIVCKTRRQTVENSRTQYVGWNLFLRCIHSFLGKLRRPWIAFEIYWPLEKYFLIIQNNFQNRIPVKISMLLQKVFNLLW